MSETVFVSSVMAGFEPVRQAAAEAIDNFGMRPVLAERVGARPQSPKQALLDEVAAADIYLLILGARYGDAGASGASPTEEEFEEARRGGKPIIVLRQQGDMEPEQTAFLSRVRGGWEQGLLYDTFTSERDVGMAVVKALRNVRQLGDVQALAPAAQTRALELATASERAGTYSGGSSARIVLVPLVSAPLLDEVALDQPDLADQVSTLARSTGLVPHASGIDARVTSDGVRLTASTGHGGDQNVLAIGPSGEIVAEGSVVVGDDANFGSMRVGPDELAALISQTSSFASQVWQRIDPRGLVQQVAVTVSIPNADMKVYGRPATPSSSISMGGAMRLPSTVIAPDPPVVMRAVDVVGDELQRRLVAAVKRVFADAGAVEES